MCLYPRLMFNKKYTRTQKNRGIIPPITDQRTRYVPIGCGNCMECRKQKAREWQVRLLEDIKHNTTGKFVTLTFNNEAIVKIIKGIKQDVYKSLKNQTKTGWREKIPKGYELDNAIAIYAVRHFMERYRKENKISLRHWFVTELGHNGTENIHLHGIIWIKETESWIEEIKKIEKHWQYGWMWKWKIQNGKPTNYVSDRTIGYMMKYVTKLDVQHKTYKTRVLSSPGIGGEYTKNQIGDWKKNKYNGEQTIETYKTTTGHKISMPVYWRNKIYSEEEREKLWINILNKEERWILGTKVDVSKGQEEYQKGLIEARKLNAQLGYGTSSEKEMTKKYEEQRRAIMIETRIKKAKEKNPSGTCFFKGKIDAGSSE